MALRFSPFSLQAHATLNLTTHHPICRTIHVMFRMPRLEPTDLRKHARPRIYEIDSVPIPQLAPPPGNLATSRGTRPPSVTHPALNRELNALDEAARGPVVSEANLSKDEVVGSASKDAPGQTFSVVPFQVHENRTGFDAFTSCLVALHMDAVTTLICQSTIELAHGGSERPTRDVARDCTMMTNSPGGPRSRCAWNLDAVCRQGRRRVNP